MTNRKWLFCVALACVTFHGEVRANDLAFEALPWGATGENVRAAFGEKVKVQQCTTQQWKEQGDRPNARSCGSLYVDDYTIDGITFRAFFNMGGPGETLNTVYLDRVATVTNDQIRTGEGADYRYNRVKKVLTSRYGEPVEVDEPTQRKKLAILSAKWAKDGTLITLIDTIIPDRRGQMYYLSVVYKPIASSQALTEPGSE